MNYLTLKLRYLILAFPSSHPQIEFLEAPLTYPSIDKLKRSLLLKDYFGRKGTKAESEKDKSDLLVATYL